MLQFTPKVKSADSCLMATHYINFTKTIYNLLCNQANRQTDKQTNKQTKATRKALTGGHTDDFITCYGFHFRSAFQLSVPPSHPVMCMHSQRYFSSWELPLKLKVWPITFNIELGPESIKAKHHNKYLCMSKVTSLESCHRDRRTQPGGGEHVHAGLIGLPDQLEQNIRHTAREESILVHGCFCSGFETAACRSDNISHLYIQHKHSPTIRPCHKD